MTGASAVPGGVDAPEGEAVGARGVVAARATRQRRWVAAALAVVLVAVGLAVHVWAPSSAASDIAGDALYAVMAYLLVVFVAPRAPSWAVALVAIAWCTAVELLQLTDLPAQWGAAFLPARLVFGSAFDARDLVVYAVAVVAAAGVDAAARLVSRPTRRV